MDYSKIAQTLDSLLGSVDLSSTTEEGVGSNTLPDGYYLCQVEKAELKESKSGNPMVVIEYSVVEDGKKTIVDESGYSQLVEAKNTEGKRIFVNYVLTNDMNVGFFVSDMLKFQVPETGESIFNKNEDFASSQKILGVCDTLSKGAAIYLMLQTMEKDGKTDQKKKPISWARARKLELI